jgi:hypothetical protein
MVEEVSKYWQKENDCLWFAGARGCSNNGLYRLVNCRDWRRCDIQMLPRYILCIVYLVVICVIYNASSVNIV